MQEKKIKLRNVETEDGCIIEIAQKTFYRSKSAVEIREKKGVKYVQR